MLGSLSRFPPDRRLLTRVRLWNYKSIAACDVALRQIAFLVGPNGSGKSNFLDALRFTADALSSNLDHALRIRGGIGLVRTLGRRTEPFGIRLHLELPAYRGWYALTIAAKGEFGFEICREECHLVERQSNRKHCFRVEHGKVVDASVSIAPKAEADRLYLMTVSGLKAFRSAFDALAGMRSSNPIPDRIRPIKPPASARSLHRDASNLASVLGSLEKRAPGFKTRIDQYLGSIVPGIAKTSRWPKDTDETIAFSQDVEDDRDRLPASSMSDGTLRTLGILLALFQGAAAGESERQLVGIEEPEAALHRRRRSADGRNSGSSSACAGAGHQPQRRTARWRSGRLDHCRGRGSWNNAFGAGGQHCAFGLSGSAVHRWRAIADGPTRRGKAGIPAASLAGSV